MKNDYKQSQLGFTLIELLIVLVIIGIVASFALLATGDFGFDKRVGASAEQFAQLVRFAEEQAILQPSVIGIEILPQGYRFHRYLSVNNDSQAQWVLITTDPLLTYRAWPNGIYAQLTSTQKSTSFIIISPTGDITPFTIELLNNRKMLYQIVGNPDGQVAILKSK